MKRHLCASPGCFASVDTPGGYCDRHQGEKRAKDKRIAERTKNDATAWRRGNSAEYRWVYRDPRWRKARAEALKREPMCRMCGQRATEADHIIPHKGRSEYAFNMDNLQALCHGCHMRKTRAERGQRPIPPSEKTDG